MYLNAFLSRWVGKRRKPLKAEEYYLIPSWQSLLNKVFFSIFLIPFFRPLTIVEGTILYCLNCVMDGPDLGLSGLFLQLPLKGNAIDFDTYRWQTLTKALFVLSSE